MTVFFLLLFLFFLFLSLLFFINSLLFVFLRKKKIKLCMINKRQNVCYLRCKEPREFNIFSCAHAHQKRIHSFNNLIVNVNPLGNALLCEYLHFVFINTGILGNIVVNFLNKSRNLLFTDVVNRNQFMINGTNKRNKHCNRKIVCCILNVKRNYLYVAHGPLSDCAQELKLKVGFCCNLAFV